MSYDIRLGVKVEGGDNLYAVIDEPERNSPTYNLSRMFRACTGWDYKKGKWYNVSEVLPLIEHGIHELRFNRKEYEKYDTPNGVGTTNSALADLESMMDCIRHNSVDSCTWNAMPIDLLYICW